MKPKVFVDRPVPAEVAAYLAEHCRCSIWDKEERLPRDVLLEQLADAEGLLTSFRRIDNELLEHAKLLKVVSTISVGYNHFDLAAMKQHGVMGTHTPHVLDDSVADLVFALMLGAARRITELDQYVKQGNWKPQDGRHLFGIDVHHRTLGIIGMGRIGEAIARRANFGFGMEVLYHNRSRKPEAEQQYGARYCTLEELLRSSDYVVMMTPLTESTTRMIGCREFRMMKPSAIFINASRGKTVDEPALIEALQEGVIRAAGLDVFEREPVEAGNPLLQMPNVIALPHIGSATAQTRFDMAMLAAHNIVCALSGQTPPNLVEELK